MRATKLPHSHRQWQPRISVAIATYNGHGFIDEQIKSILAQDYLPDEIVICDDCSSDHTLEVLRQYMSQDLPNFLIKQNLHNVGFTRNFEQAISLCTGEVIFFSDQDDYWFPNKVSTVVEAFRQSPEALLAIHDGEIVGADLVSTGITKLGQLEAGGYGESSLATGALTAVRRELLPLALPFPLGIAGHDIWIHRLAELLGSRIVLHDVLQKIRRHGLNTSNWIVSSARPINRLSVLVSQLSAPMATSYSDRLIFNAALAERLSSVLNAGYNLGLHATSPELLGGLRSERQAILRREEILRKRFWERKVAAIAMLVSGEYRHFNGYKSFCRDFLR